SGLWRHKLAALDLNNQSSESSCLVLLLRFAKSLEFKLTFVRLTGLAQRGRQQIVRSRLLRVCGHGFAKCRDRLALKAVARQQLSPKHLRTPMTRIKVNRLFRVSADSFRGCVCRAFFKHLVLGNRAIVPPERIFRIESSKIRGSFFQGGPILHPVVTISEK